MREKGERLKKAASEKLKDANDAWIQKKEEFAQGRFHCKFSTLVGVLHLKRVYCLLETACIDHFVLGISRYGSRVSNKPAKSKVFGVSLDPNESEIPPIMVSTIEYFYQNGK